MSSYLINYESSKDLKLTVMPDVVSDFSAAPSKFTSPATNPFSLGNNKWRIRQIIKKAGKRSGNG
jgi:hypothetical protein